MRHYNKSQINQDKVIDDSCYVTPVLMTFALKVILLSLIFSLNASFTKCKNFSFEGELWRKPDKKPPNPVIEDWKRKLGD